MRSLMAALYLANLRTYLLDTHDVDFFSDHLRIQQDWIFFSSSDKVQASGRPVAEAVKYLVFLILVPRRSDHGAARAVAERHSHRTRPTGAGPLCYLYMASASSSLPLAWSLDLTHRCAHIYATIALLLAILASSYRSLA